ncbi:dTMP kinase [Saccharopolyspora hattusasensis]|uniref:dTMP kinase n=1 Tax=Saccharopolyspora hattusasensis TaxID=1128679 RepID=UPI003D96C907
MRPQQPGMLVTVDGLGGAGKSTLVQLVTERLTERGYPVHATTEPSRAPLGEIARYGTNTYHGLALACLVAADRYHHLDSEIRPQLRGGFIVLCDRYMASSLVLQRMDGVPADYVQALNVHADIPDLAVVLTADPAVTAERIRVRGSHGRFENGLNTSRTEAELYQDAITRLDELGWPLWLLDTSAVAPEALAEQVTARITELADDRSASAATA